MQTSSKVEFDNWKDINAPEIINIRPVGTYTRHPHRPFEPHHPHGPFDPYHPHPHVPVDPYHPHVPVDFQPMPPMPHVRPIDVDGDGFVEDDIIVGPSRLEYKPVDPSVTPGEYGSVTPEETVWSNAKIVDTESHEVIAESPKEEEELKEVEVPVKAIRPRRVNRGGRRKKED